jgi:hypothetical protein
MHAPRTSAPPQQPAWDQAAFIAAMDNFTLNHAGTDWIFDSGASSHMYSNTIFLSTWFPSSFSTITIRDGSTISVSFPATPTYPLPMPIFFYAIFLFFLPNQKAYICSAIYQVILAFDPFGLSVKDLKTGRF